MKKWLAAAASAVVLTLPAMSDILRVEAGGGAWMQKPTGSLAYTTSSDAGSVTSTEKETSVGYAWIYLKHPVPVLPNVRLEYTALHDKGDVEVTKTGGVDVSGLGAASTSKFDAQEYDAILYYNLLDNTFWTTLDLGIDVKMLDYKFDVAPTTTPVATDGYSKSGTLVVPMAYLRARLQVPATGFGFEGLGSYMSYSGVTVYDARAKVDWTMDFVPVIQPGIEVGYRIQKVEYDQNDKEIAANIEFSGVYVGAMLRF